jgi:isoleucyl-tRNA synthetase
LCVGPEIDYVLVETFNQYTNQPIKVVLAKDLFKKHFEDLIDYKILQHKNDETKVYSDVFEMYDDYQSKDIPFDIKKLIANGKLFGKTIKEFKGKDLVGIEYEQLLPYALPQENPEKAFRVIADNFVTTEDGTGIVHIAPTFGSDDYRVAKENGIPAMLVKDENGNLVPLVDLQGRFRPEMGEFAGMYVKNEYYAKGEEARKISRRAHFYQTERRKQSV